MCHLKICTYRVKSNIPFNNFCFVFDILIPRWHYFPVIGSVSVLSKAARYTDVGWYAVRKTFLAKFRSNFDNMIQLAHIAFYISMHLRVTMF